MSYLMKTSVLKSSQHTYVRFLTRNTSDFQISPNKTVGRPSHRLSSKTIRNLFLNYFVKDKNHKFVNSSPVFLNNDPSLLFVNAGMNQFRSVLLNKTYPGHPFYGLQRAANSQKCIRLSGKHNDLRDVGVDLYHHTFFEMLGNWSFGDYSKLDACKMSWDLLTNIYGLNPSNLYVTYFGGDNVLGIPSDQECLQAWLEVGVDPNHIFPFGAKDNFWEMADKGPCGPCTEIHYDFSGLGYQNVASRINNEQPDVMEIWNLVFIQYNREQGGNLKSLPSLNIDTGMGFERLTAILQGTNSNYNTDIFNPIFKAIQYNFKVRPYLGRTGSSDNDGIDTAYRILADHSRMFSVAIADGLFPDAFDAGHVLRKIIRRAAYSANRVMKTRPGVLSSLVPCVAETLDFFPEIGKHIDEIKYVVNEEEKMFHLTVNKGRKTRNKMMSDGNTTILDGQNVWELQKVYGLEENVLQDIADEVDLTVDWEDYRRVCQEKLQLIQKQKGEKANILSQMSDILKEKNIPLTDKSFIYHYNTAINKYGVDSISASVHAIIKENEIVSSVDEGSQCILITDKSNFYPEGGGQASDIGIISNKDFIFKVDHTSSSQGYVFHQGVISKGNLISLAEVQMDVDKEHRFCCSQNHTATHLINAALRKVLPYTAQRSSFVGPERLTLGFSAKSQLTLSELEVVETFVNSVILEKHRVIRKEMTFEELLNNPSAVLLRGEDYPDCVSVICVENNGPNNISVEPCCGTHVHNTSDIGGFLIIPSNSHSGSTKLISAVTGKQVFVVRRKWAELEKDVLNLRCKVKDTLSDINVSLNTYTDLLRDVNVLIKKIQSSSDVPLLKLEECKDLLQDLKLNLNDIINCSAKSDLNLDPLAISKLQSSNAVNLLKSRNIPETIDSYKYDYDDSEVKILTSKIVAIFRNQEPSEKVERGLQCQVILNKTNFYAEGDDQASDEGIFFCKDFSVKIHNVYKIGGYVFHDGYVEEGDITPDHEVQLSVDHEHRLACSQNHTALHLLNSALKKELPYFFPYSGLCGSKLLQLTFTTKESVSDKQLQKVENFVNDCISSNLKVVKNDVPLNALKEVPFYKSSLIKEFKSVVPTTSIEDKNSVISLEPCCGTHVKSTSEIGNFIIVLQKSNKFRERIIHAVTGKQAEIVKSDGEIYHKALSELENYTLRCLEKLKLDNLELWDCLQEVKTAKAYHETDLPLLLFRNHQTKLTELTKQLEEATNDFVQEGFENIKSEMKTILEKFGNKKFIVYKLETVGDGKKILNYATECSSDKPVIYFVREGHKSVICSCSVPKHAINPNFSASLWINPVASLLEGRTRTLTKDPELFYSVVSNRLDRLDEAVDVAERFIRTSLNIT